MVAKKTATREVAVMPGSTPVPPADAKARPGGAKKAPAAKDASVRKAPARTAPAKTAPAKKQAPAKKAAAKKEAAAEQAPAKKAAAKKTAVDAAPARKTAAGKASAKKAAKTAGTAAVAAERTTSRATAKAAGAEGAAAAARKTGARKVVAKKTAGTARKTAAEDTAGGLVAAPPGELAVRPGEDPWTAGEVAEARTELLSEVMRLRVELEASEMAISGLMRDSGDGAGDDQADTGTKNITRESELALAANATSMLEQTERALERLEAGTYGLCENCGKPIGKARMQAFPRATLCVDCKQKQERRH
ncbi:TraR/DksA C4-type zinc finger protein [Streptomyces sp. NPDC029216]|uniref:TraR/DksA family transcriptional regulator n=1 Tax=Streptomyces sp. NPDC029216 TaxID=3154701 RepID=UPI0033DE17FB